MKRIISTSSARFTFLASLLLGVVVGFVGIPTTDDIFVKDAEARVGRPASPGSVAGVRRRTRRRHVRRAAAASTVATLPAGCVTVVTGGRTYYQYGTVYYRPYYEGNELVYVEESP